jgi:hypothetical protein
MKNAIPRRPDQGIPVVHVQPAYSPGKQVAAILFAIWIPYLAVPVSLILLLLQRDPHKRAALKTWAKWTALYFAAWTGALVLYASIAHR